LDANFYKNIISTYKKVDNYTKSIEMSKKFLSLNPPEEEVISTYKSIGVAYAQLKDNSNALTWYLKYLGKEEDPKVALWVCNTYYKQKDNQNTIKYANMVIAKDPGKLVAVFLRGVAKFNMGDKEGAKADFELVKNDPKYGANAQKYLDSMK
jgi:tetratricopeptide (TPR) repeat protein